MACSDGRVRIYGTKDRMLLRTLTHNPGGETAWGVAFHPTVPLVATSGRDKEVRLWDATTGRPWRGVEAPIRPERLPNIRPKSETPALAFSGDGRLLACSADIGQVEVWSMPLADARASPDLVSRLSYHQDEIKAVAFSRGGDRMASASFDGLVALWDSTGFQQLATAVSGGGECRCARFSPDGSRLAAGANGEFRVWRAATAPSAAGRWKPVPPDRSKELIFRNVAFSRDGEWSAACGQDRLFVRDMVKETTHDLDIGEDRQQAVALMFDRDPNRVFLIRRSGYWQQWAVRERALLAEGRYTEFTNVRHAAVRPDDGGVAWQTDKGVWFTPGLLTRPGAETQELDRVPNAGAVAFSPDGRLLAWGRGDGTVSWQTLGDRRQSPRRVKSHTEQMTALAFDDAGTVLAVGDGAGAIVLWDVATAQMIGAPLSNWGGRPGSGDGISSLAFAPGGLALASCSYKAGLVLWDTSPGSWAGRCRLVPDENLSGPQWVQFFGRDVPYHKTIDDLPAGDGVTDEMMAAPSRVGFWLVAVALPFWAAGCLFLVPWELLGGWRTSPQSAASVALAFVFAAFATLPQATRPGTWPLWAEKLALLAAIAGISVVFAWLQKRLACRWVLRRPRAGMDRLKLPGVRRYLRSMFQPRREPGAPPGGSGRGGPDGPPPGSSRR